MFVLLGLAILAGWVGWGVLVARVVLRGPAARGLGWGMEAALGIAGLLPLGGALDHAALVTPAALWSILAVGWVALGWRLVERRRSKVALERSAVALERSAVALERSAVALERSAVALERSAVALERGAFMWALPLALGAVVACGWAATDEVDAYRHDLELVLGYNGHDDLQAYSVFALKMFQTGTQGLEPFSERRVLAPGGQAFLQCFALLLGSDRALNLIDPALCLVVVTALFAELLRGLGAPRRALLVLVPLVVVGPKINTSALFSGAALFLALLRALDPRDVLGGRGARGVVVVALLCAGLASLKVSFVAPLGLFLLVGQVGQAVAGRSLRPLAQLAASAALGAVLLAPWMASSMESCGTWLYPYLGRGNHASSYMGDVPLAAALQGVVRALTDRHALALIGFGAIAIIVTRGERRVACATLLGSALAAKAALYLANGLYSQRYTFSFTFAAALALLACAATGLFPARAARAAAGARARALGSAVLLAASVALVFELDLGAPSRYVRALGERLLRPSRLPARIEDAPERARLARVQAAVPAGEVLLARLEKPHLLDFTRTQLRVIDLPGGAAPPPGLPLDAGPDALADYLLGQSVRYVAYDYVREAGLPDAAYRPFLQHPSPMIRGQTQRALAFQRLLMELVASRKIVHDDGLTFVMDLASTR